MKKLLFSPLFTPIFLFVLFGLFASNALALSSLSCFEPVSPLPTTTSAAPFFKIGADGAFYVMEQVGTPVGSGNAVLHKSLDGVSWSPVSVPLTRINSFDLHPDSSNSGVLFAGGVNAYAISKDGGQTWVRKGGTSGTLGGSFSSTALNTQNNKQILVINSSNSSIYRLNTVTDNLDVFNQTTWSPLFYNITSYGDNVYITYRSPSESYPFLVILFNATNHESFPASYADDYTTAWLPLSDGSFVIGNSSGNVLKHNATWSGPIAEMGAPILSFVEQSDKVLIFANSTNAARALAVYNKADASLSYLELNSTTASPDLLPVRGLVSPTDNKVYVIVWRNDPNPWRLYTLNPACSPSLNNAPVINSLLPPSSASYDLYRPVLFSVNASDIDNDALSYNWTQLTGPTLNASSLASGAFNESSFEISFYASGNYTFSVTVTDNGSPSASAVSTISVNVARAEGTCASNSECSSGQSCVQNECVAASAPACTSNSQCADNEQCSNNACVEVTCGTDSLLYNHSCVPLSSVKICANTPHAEPGSCCNGQWMPGLSQCPAPINVTGSTPTAQNPVAFVDSLTKGGASNTLLLTGGAVLLLLLLALVYFLFLKKKPPSEDEPVEESLSEQSDR